MPMRSGWSSALRGRAVQEPQRRIQRSRTRAASAQTGVNRPHVGSFRRTPISAEYNIFDSERYVLTLDNRALRDAAASAPYEFIEILVNEEQYGGGGIFNDQATTAVDTGFAEYVFVHEFGHHFAGLADEYYTSDVAYETGAAEHPEPWEPNVTALRDPQAAQVARPGRAGDATADAVGQRSVRSQEPRSAGTAARVARQAACRRRRSTSTSASRWRGIRSSCRR